MPPPGNAAGGPIRSDRPAQRKVGRVDAVRCGSRGSGAVRAGPSVRRGARCFGGRAQLTFEFGLRWKCASSSSPRSRMTLGRQRQIAQCIDETTSPAIPRSRNRRLAVVPVRLARGGRRSRTRRAPHAALEAVAAVASGQRYVSRGGISARGKCAAKCVSRLLGSSVHSRPFACACSRGNWRGRWQRPPQPAGAELTLGCNALTPVAQRRAAQQTARSRPGRRHITPARANSPECRCSAKAR